MIFLVDAAWLRLAEGGALLEALYTANSVWAYWPAGATVMDQDLVDSDPAHPRWAGQATATVNAGQAGPRSVASLVTPSRFWAHHPTVPREALHLRILLSYHYFKDQDLDTIIPKKFQPPYPAIFADSGAFSAYTQGVTIAWQDYAAWLKRYRHWFAVMSNLDVIGNPAGTERHQGQLEDAGLPVLPVFHTGEPWHILETLLTRYRYIALGGMVPYLREWKTRLMPWLVRCFRLATDTAVFHGFGCTTWEVVKALPWYSVDSSSWGAGFRYGQVPVFDWQRGRFRDCALGDPVSVGKVAPLIRALGFDPADFALRARNTRTHNCGIAALSYCLAAAWLQKRWAGVSQVYLVESNTHWNTTAPAAQALFLVDCESHGTDVALGATSVGAVYLSDTSTWVNPADAASVDTTLAQASQHVEGGGGDLLCRNEYRPHDGAGP
jgi:hypothetical protein